MRDLPAKPGSVQPEQGFAIKWELARGAVARLAELKVNRAQRLVLATDPDREGEAISWHVVQELQVWPAHAVLSRSSHGKGQVAPLLSSTWQQQ